MAGECVFLYLEDDRTTTEIVLHSQALTSPCLLALLFDEGFFFPRNLNASSTRSAATMATSCQMWRPDRGRCFKTYGIVTVLFMDLVLQCVNGMFKELVIDSRLLGSLIWLTRMCVCYLPLASSHCVSINWLANELAS